MVRAQCYDRVFGWGSRGGGEAAVEEVRGSGGEEGREVEGCWRGGVERVEQRRLAMEGCRDGWRGGGGVGVEWWGEIRLFKLRLAPRAPSQRR